MKQSILKILTVFTALFASFTGAYAQTAYADVSVRVSSAGAGLSQVSVKMYKDNILIQTKETDDDGYCVFQTLDPGTYDVVLEKEGYDEEKTTGLVLTIGKNEDLRLTMSETKGIKEVKISKAGKKNQISLTNNEKVVDNKKLLTNGQRGIGAISSTIAGVTNTTQGISVRGTRADGNGTFIDGMRAIGGGAVPTLGTDQIAVNIGGIPAMYGDLTGGAFSYTTRGATAKLVTALEGISSTGLDPFGYNTIEGFVSGPLWKKSYKDLADGKTKELVKLGFMLNGNLGYFKDPAPTRTGVYVLNENKLEDIEQNPLVITPNGFVHRGSYLRESDFDLLRARPNSPLYQGNFIGKLEFRPTNDIAVTAYASYFYSSGLAASNSIMNYKNNGRSDGSTLRGYLQFTQNFKTDPKGSIKNAFYTARMEYQSTASLGRDANHLNNIFDYGYVGTFQSFPTPVFAYSNYDAQQNPNKQPRMVYDQFGNVVQLRNYWEQVGFSDTLMTFTPSDLNPLRARYTQNVYDYYASRGFNVRNASTVIASQGIMNGFNPNNVYSLWGTPGGITSGYGKSQTDRYSLFAIGQMQVKPKSVGGRERAAHDLQAGLYYEQQVSRSYSLGANSLWILMGQLMNRHIAELDRDNPILSYDANGVFTDTVRYNRLVNYTDQSNFDRSFRNKLIAQGARDVYGKPINDQTFVDINSYKPGDFDINMFTADELLNNGNGFVSYFGYDHMGNKINRKPAIEEFLNNPAQRTIGAFRPVYMAAWLQDQFNFKDLIFRLGLRMESYDANQYVLKDPYTLYPIRTAAEVTKINGLDVLHPSNIGSDYKVYVNDLKSPTRIVGYRNGDRWFNADGSEQRNPEFLANQTSNGRIAPYLVATNTDSLVLGKDALRDFTPIVNILPRIWFSFPLEPGRKTFYVSYDVLAQRPNSGASFLTIDELYYLKNRQGSTISNGDLKSRVKTDYEVGYKQYFGRKKTRALEMAASYSEIRNDFGLYQIAQGFPVTYTTFRNIDFATITGFRGTFVDEIGPLSILLSYALQFADGTGSNINSQATLIASNQPNLRNVIPLGELDIRHTLKASATWAWGGGRVGKKNMYNGPMLGGKEIFRYTSFNIIANAFSGAPYTPTTRPVQIGAVDRAQIKGVPFGARLPWQNSFDINITKGFNLKRPGINGKEAKNDLLLNVFVWCQNLLNTRNVVSVFPYTGQAMDDGFLNSQQGQLLVSNQIDAQSYTDLYKIFLNSQTGMLGGPRTLRVGLRVNFN
jgi:hypothetical protein